MYLSPFRFEVCISALSVLYCLFFWVLPHRRQKIKDKSIERIAKGYNHFFGNTIALIALAISITTIIVELNLKYMEYRNIIENAERILQYANFPKDIQIVEVAKDSLKEVNALSIALEFLAWFITVLISTLIITITHISALSFFDSDRIRVFEWKMVLLKKHISSSFEIELRQEWARMKNVQDFKAFQEKLKELMKKHEIEK